MTNKIQREQGYIVIEQSTQLSMYNGKPVTTVEFVGIADKKIYKTYIQKTNRNFGLWEYIIKRPNLGIAVSFHNFDISNEDKNIINADSVPKIEIETDKDTLFNELTEHWEIEKRKTNNPVFNELFDFINK